MTAKQQLGFVLAGVVFVLSGVVMAAWGWIYAAKALMGQGVMLALAGGCWLILTAFVRNRPPGERHAAGKDDDPGRQLNKGK